MQKYVVLWAYVYLPSAEVWDWADLLRIYRLGSDPDPGFSPDLAIQWSDPQTGVRYLAKRYGDESIFGKTYDKGIAAKMLQWANQLTAKTYVLDPATATAVDLASGAAKVFLDPVTKRPKIKVDPNIDPTDPVNVSCDDNTACVQLRNYRGLLDFTRDMAARTGNGGVYVSSPQ
jgi:hypothetical protein